MTPRNLYGIAVLSLTSVTLVAQETVEQRLRRLERQNKELQEQVGAMSNDLERIDLGGLIPPLSQAKRGVGQGAAKVYDVSQGLSIGGYGEFLFQQRDGRTDQADAQRAIVYVGYKFSDKWVFNSELEFEHGSTSGGGSVSIEFGYLDYLHSDALNFRGGILLSPLGLINELHEPTAFMAASRPQTEQRIIPTTWREIGAGAYGDFGDFSYRAYAMTSLDGANFSNAGLRGGRQRGARAESDDWSLVSRVDYVGVPGLTIGGSVSYGDSGQDNLDDTPATSGGPFAVPAMRTTILEAHIDYRTGPWQFRTLIAQAKVQDAAAFNTSTGNNLASGMLGYYGEVGCDVLTWLYPEATAQFTPFFRYERIDTQRTMPTGFLSDPSQEDEIYSFGINYKPVPQVVIKLDYEDWDNDFDRFNILLGYVF